MNILEKINMNILNWLLDIQERNHKKLISSLKEIERQFAESISYVLKEDNGEEKFDTLLLKEMIEYCRDYLGDESLVEELDCYKNYMKKYK